MAKTIEGVSAKALSKFNYNETQVSPKDLLIVTDKTHPLWQERANWAVDEELVATIQNTGFMSSIIVGTDNVLGATVVVAGRRRTKAAVAAKLTQIPAFDIGDISQYPPSELQALMLNENEKRVNSDTLGRAKEALRLYNTRLEEFCPSDWTEGVEWKPTKEQKLEAQLFTAKVFGVSKERLRDMFNMLDDEKVAPALTKAISNGDVSFKGALRFLKLDPTEQEKALEGLKPVIEKRKTDSAATGKGTKGASDKDVDAALNKTAKVTIKRDWLEIVKGRRSTPADVKEFVKELLNPGSTKLPYLPGTLAPPKPEVTTEDE